MIGLDILLMVYSLYRLSYTFPFRHHLEKIFQKELLLYHYYKLLKIQIQMQVLRQVFLLMQ